MVFPKQLKILSVVVALVASASTARGQHNIQFDQPFVPDAPISSDGFVADHIQPFIDFDAFDYDFQSFAPVDRSLFGGETPEGRVGFFFNWDRMYVNIPRAQGELTMASSAGDLNTNFVAQKKGDWVWGNRFNSGYMTEEDHGWLLSLSHVEGGYGDTPAELGRSTRSNFWSGELNKVYRIPLKGGANLEFYGGGRYIYLSDFSLEDIDAAWEYQEVQNQIAGGQLGLRYFKQKGRWLLSADFRTFLGHNTQFMAYQDTENHVASLPQVNNPPAPPNEPAEAFIPFRDERRLDEFVPMVELRLDATYYVTRDLALNFGFDFMHMFRGIVRSNPEFPGLNENQTPPVLAGDGIIRFPTFNDNNLTLPGIGMGIVWNR